MGIKVIDQRKLYIANRKRRSQEFQRKVLMDYNTGLSAGEIASRYVNPQTGKPYTRQYIHMIIRTMRDSANK